MRASLSLLSLCFWLIIFLVACSIGLAPARVVAGEEFPVEKIRQIQEGMTSDQVQQILGRPWKVSSKGDSESWQYFFRLRQDDVIRALGLIPIRRPLHVWEKEAKILLIANRVEKIDFTDRLIK
jgi:outer membrane protein assembly factor BamE (lipoprotein component of BamABCDE complex)